MNDKKPLLVSVYSVEPFMEVMFDSFWVVGSSKVIRKEIFDEFGTSSNFLLEEVDLVEAVRSARQDNQLMGTLL
jgi:hypothetical protein